MTRLLRICLVTIALNAVLAACAKQDATETVAPVAVDQPAPVVVPDTVMPELDVPALLKRAENLRQQAAHVGHEWSNHAPTISAARKALDAGDTDEATRLASLAVILGEQSVLQAKTEAERWREAVPE